MFQTDKSKVHEAPWDRDDVHYKVTDLSFWQSLICESMFSILQNKTSCTCALLLTSEKF